MSIPKAAPRKPMPAELAAGWQAIFDAVRVELIEKHLPEDRATEVAAYVAATLAKEARYGYSPRDN